MPKYTLEQVEEITWNLVGQKTASPEYVLAMFSSALRGFADPRTGIGQRQVRLADAVERAIRANLVTRS